MLRYAITDRTLYPGSDDDRQTALVRQAERLAHEGIDFLQIREKDLSAISLSTLAERMHTAIHTIKGTKLRLLLNAPLHLARQASISGGVHLPATAPELTLLKPQRSGGDLLVSVACHTTREVEQTAAHADLILFAPVFEKRVAGLQIQDGVGLQLLRQACQAAGNVPVLALGGVTAANAPLCLQAGAAGIAGIRLFALL